MVESANDDRRHRGHDRGVGEAALTLNQNVALSAVAVEGVDVVGGVRRTDVADSLNQEVPLCADTAFVFVDFVLAADWVARVEGTTNTVVVPEASLTNALAEDVVVDLVEWADDGAGVGTRGRGDVGGVGDVGVGEFGWAVAIGVGRLCA